MGGATFVCGSFEGNDKSASPIVSVMEEAFVQAFGRKRRGRLEHRLRRWLAARLGRAPTGEVARAEEAILHVRFNEEGEIPPAIAARFLPFFERYQARLLAELNIPDDVDAIWPFVTPTSKAKYGFVRDAGWHLYCLHDLIPACRISIDEQLPIQVLW